ncbi:MAG TPA: ATP-dependent helicase HrpB [Gemmatimonadales bacterium]
MNPLPIDPVLPGLREALFRGPAVLLAPPGSGKTTRVPLALLGEPWLRGGRIVMLEPRRLAARAAAGWMAHLREEAVGGTVGYRIRRDTRVGPATRIEVVTEGVLARLLSADPGLEGVGLVIFDEFHERSLHGDLGLALTLHSRALLRRDLRILVMSATLDGAPVARLLGGAPVIAAEGRAFPVETRYVPPRRDTRIDAAAAGAVRDALAQETGDILVFLPGAAEIRRAAERLEEPPLGASVRVRPLYGDLAPEAQEAAIAPSAPGERKVVLATSIAETSLTIEGVRVVIDAGFARVPRFSPRTGMTRLETLRVSRASADQRRGRAGRTGPGVCLRLWPEAAAAELRPFETPEILEADLAPLALELADAGVSDPGELAWLDPPPVAALAQARELLGELGALDAAARITPHGRAMAKLALHPRLAHMLLRARALGLGALGCELAALLGERDVFRGANERADITLRLEALRRGDARASPGALRRARAESGILRRRLGVRTEPEEPEPRAAGLLLALAYPDRVGQRRPGAPGRFLLRNGLGAYVAPDDPLGLEEFVAAAELDGRPRESRIFLAAPVARADLERELGAQIVPEETVAWDEAADGVVARRRERLGGIVLADAPLRDPDPAAVSAAVLDRLMHDGAAALPWTAAALGLRSRLRFLHRLDPRWPDVSDEALTASLGEWLGPALVGVRRRADLARIDLAGLLLARLSREQRGALAELAPTHVTVPSGSRIPIDYGDPEAPVLAVRLQEVFGLAETPRVNGVPITLHLLSPAHRPVQVTRDLANFWRTTYFDVRKDLKGRYPKHYWPDDPLEAEPTRRIRPRRGGGGRA